MRGDTTFLDYGSIEAKKKVTAQLVGRNGLVLHSALAIEPQNGQSLGLLSQKLWNREPKAKPPQDENPTQKKQAAARKKAQTARLNKKERVKR